MSETALRMRPYRRGDLDALYALDVLCFARAFRFSRATMRAAAEAENAVSVLAWQGATEAEQTLAGFCLSSLEVLHDERVGYIATLDVDPAHRRRGLGRVLLRHMEELLGARGAREVMLHVFVDNGAAQRLYAASGYVRQGRVVGFYGRAGDAWVYRKALSGESAGGLIPAM